MAEQKTTQYTLGLTMLELEHCDLDDDDKQRIHDVMDAQDREVDSPMQNALRLHLVEQLSMSPGLTDANLDNSACSFVDGWHAAQHFLRVFLKEDELD